MQVHFKRMDVWIKNARFERITVPDSKLGVRAKEGMKGEKGWDRSDISLRDLILRTPWLDELVI